MRMLRLKKAPVIALAAALALTMGIGAAYASTSDPATSKGAKDTLFSEAPQDATLAQGEDTQAAGKEEPGDAVAEAPEYDAGFTAEATEGTGTVTEIETAFEADGPDMPGIAEANLEPLEDDGAIIEVRGPGEETCEFDAAPDPDSDGIQEIPESEAQAL